LLSPLSGSRPCRQDRATPARHRIRSLGRRLDPFHCGVELDGLFLNPLPGGKTLLNRAAAGTRSGVAADTKWASMQDGQGLTQARIRCGMEGNDGRLRKFPLGLPRGQGFPAPQIPLRAITASIAPMGLLRAFRRGAGALQLRLQPAEHHHHDEDQRRTQGGEDSDINDPEDLIGNPASQPAPQSPPAPPHQAVTTPS
jgi:hypothetical protein